MRFLSFLFVVLLFSCSRGEYVVYKQYANHNDTVKYVGMNECKACHLEIYESYIQTGMGKSFSSAVKVSSSLPNSPDLVYDSIKDLSYMPVWKNDSLWIKEFRIFNFDTIHQIDKKVDYIIGSGHHTNSHLFQINGYLHQIPYTYYAQDKISDLPPGYENGNNTRFAREINMECISCHNAYPNHEEGSNNKYASIPKGIDCERCHGPGEVHVLEKSMGIIIDTSKYIDYSIVNPSKLPKDLQFDVCQRCHLQGTAILAENTSFTDFKPGMHLNDYIDVYLPKYEDDNSFIMASHVERLKQSECFKNSDMTCLNCHNPHKSVQSLSTNYFDRKCMDCHNVCNVEENISNCASCHMPSSSSSDIPHVTISDHKIAVHKEKKYESNENRVFLGLHSINNDNPTNLSKAKAYLKRFESFESNPVYLDSAFAFLQISEKESSFPYFIQYYYLKKDYFSIVNHYLAFQNIDFKKFNKEVISLALSRVADAYSQNGLTLEAISLYNKSINLMPLVIDYKLKLVALHIELKNFKEAESLLDELKKMNPERKEIYLNISYINILKKKYQLAEENLSIALKLDPDYILAYENLVLLNIEKNDLFLAKKYLKDILKIDSNNSKAKRLLNKFN